VNKQLKIFSVVTVLTAITLVAFGSMAFGAQKKQAHKRDNLSTDINFDGRLVKGKYQSSSESITTVENEKNLDDLIGVRKNFKDRNEKAEDLR